MKEPTIEIRNQQLTTVWNKGALTHALDIIPGIIIIYSYEENNSNSFYFFAS